MNQQELFLKVIKNCFTNALETNILNDETVYQIRLKTFKGNEIRQYSIDNKLTEEMQKKFSNVWFVYRITDRKENTNEVTEQWICLFYQQDDCLIDTSLLVKKDGKQTNRWNIEYIIFNNEFKELSKNKKHNTLGKELIDLLSKQPQYRLLIATGMLSIKQ